MNYYSLYPSHFKLDGGAMFGIIPKPLWEKKLPSDEFNRVEMNCRMFVIQTQEKNILIDLGVGDYHGEKFEKRFGLQEIWNPVNKTLKENLGIGVEEITDIVLTHLHFDHVGGLGTNDGITPLFPNATLHLHKKHFEYSLNPTPRDQGSFQAQYFHPLIKTLEEKKQIHWLSETDDLILKDSKYELKFKISHGHTPFQVLPYDKKMIYMGDLLPTSHHLNVAWTMGYDLHPGDSSLERASMYEWIIQNQLIVIFDHDKDFWGARIKQLDKYKFEYLEKYPSHSNIFEKHNV